MTRELDRAVRRWLRQEAKGTDEQAERAFRRVFAHWRMPQVSPGFAARVLRAGGWVSPPHRQVVPPTVLKWSFLCGLVLALVSALAASGFAVSLVQSGAALKLVTGTVASLTDLWVSLATVAGSLVGVGQTLASTLSSPLVILAAGLCALMSASAFRVLNALLVTDGRSDYANLA